jgi:hypothetical protein
MNKTSKQPTALSAKMQMIDFLQNTNPGESYSFFVLHGEAEKFIHRMRVELSRFRNVVKYKYNRRIKPFKVIVLSVEQVDPVLDEVTLRRHQSDYQVLTEELAGVFNEVAITDAKTKAGG